MDRIAVAVSGGPDSVCLLDNLLLVDRPGNPALVVLHVDHGVRPESSSDARFVADLAAMHRVPFHLLKARPEHVLKDGRASEGRLRDERYRLFRQAMARCGATELFLGHHRDDQVESIILSALRGSGLRGLAGMPRRRLLDPGGPRIVRPFLDLPGRLLREDLDRRGVPFQVDPTNQHPAFMRNRVRLLFLPRLRQEIGPEIDRRLLRLGRLARILWRRADRAGSQLDPSLGSDALHAGLQQLAGRPIRRSLSLLLQDRLSTRAVGVFEVASQSWLRVIEGRVSRVTRPSLPASVSIEIVVRSDRNGRLHRWLQKAPAELRRRRIEYQGRFYLDADRLQLPLCVRTRQPGDRYRPLGFPRPGKLKDQLISRKIPRELRDHLVVLADRDRIVAVEGLPPAHDAAITAATRKVLRIRLRRAERSC